MSLTDEHPFIRGVVGWLDLCSDRIQEQLEKWAIHPKLKGIRHVIHDEPDDAFMLRDDFRNGISLLQQYGLTYDLLLFPKHLNSACELVREFPEQRFVLDHIAKPDIANGKMQPWKDDLYRLASFSHVYCKLSGMVTEACLNEWSNRDFEPYLDVVFDAFGPERLMIGSDWPVCNLGGEYNSVMQIVMRYLRTYPQLVQDQVLGGTCAEFYGLG